MIKILLVIIFLLFLLNVFTIGMRFGWFNPSGSITYDLVNGSTRSTAVKMADQLANMGIKCTILNRGNKFSLVIDDVYYDSQEALLELGALLGNIEGKGANI